MATSHKMHNFKAITSTTLPLLLSVFISFWSALALAASESFPKCAYISSYAPEYEWQISLESGLIPLLSPHCQIETFYMNSKQLLSAQAVKTRARDAKSFIEAFQPDLLIFSDDNAVKEVLMPFFQNSSLPAVFCGVNETGHSYGLPYQNTTGMIEKSNFPALLRELQKINPSSHQVVYLTSTGITEQKNAAYFTKYLKEANLKGYTLETTHQAQWRQAFLKINQDPTIDAIVLGSHKPFQAWDSQDNIAFIRQHQTKPLWAIQPWMMPYANLAIVKSAKEQGVWAALSAQAILQGTQPNTIPIVPNQQFEKWVNRQTLIQFPELKIPQDFLFYETPPLSDDNS